MNKQTVRVSVRDLQIGDMTSGSKITIVERPFTSVRCPAGRLWVRGVRESGRPFLAAWRADTKISVFRSV